MVKNKTLPPSKISRKSIESFSFPDRSVSVKMNKTRGTDIELNL